MAKATAPVELPKVRGAVEAATEGAIALRRDIHRHAELSTEERRTQRVIIERLRAAGLEDVRPCADTGVSALVRGALPGPTLLWRADIDALPLQEETRLPFASTNGAMHACGHDGHVAIAVTMAELLQASREALRGNVRFAFQPAEEHVGGAQRMIHDGVLEDPQVARVFGLHLWAATPVGAAHVQPGPIFAAATHFRIIIRGRGGHAAAPHQTADPVVTAAHVIVALQTVVSRSVDPAETAVLTVGRVQGGVRGNIIPNECWMSGTIRTYDPGVLARVLKRVDEIVAGVTAAWQCEYQFDHSTLGACVNDPDSAELVAAAARGFLGESHVTPARAMGADDMNLFLEARPGAYFMLGAMPREAERVYPHHHPRFDFDEAAIPLGIELGLRVLEAAAEPSR